MQSMKDQGPNHKARKVSLITFLLLLGGVVIVSYRMVSPYLLAVFIGGIIALLARPVYRKLLAKGVGPKLASAIVTAGVLVLVIGPLALFISVAIRQGISVGQYVSENQLLSTDTLLQYARKIPYSESIIGDPASLQRRAQGTLQSSGKVLSGAVVGVLSAVPDMLLQAVLAMIACYFLLLDGRRFINWAAGKVPLDVFVRRRLLQSFSETAISTIWATLTAAGAQALLMFGAYLILGIPAAFLAAGATFIFAWIPMVGSTPVWLIGAAYLASQGSVGKAIAMIAIGIFTSVIDNVIRPWVLKGRGEMHPLVSLVAIFGGIQMFGLFGVFVGPIVAAILISTLQVWPAVARHDRMIEPGNNDILEEPLITGTQPLESPQDKLKAS